jgi:hypothetical protein
MLDMANGKIPHEESVHTILYAALNGGIGGFVAGLYYALRRNRQHAAPAQVNC